MSYGYIPVTGGGTTPIFNSSGPQTFGTFDDTDIWIPKTDILAGTGQECADILAFTAGHKIHITTTAAASQYASGLVGVISRFRVHPDPTSKKLKLYVKLSPCSCPLAVNVNCAMFFGFFLVPDTQALYGFATKNHTVNNYCCSVQQSSRNAAVITDGPIVKSAVFAGNPAPATSIELEAEYQKAQNGGGASMIAIDNNCARYNVDGAGWNTIAVGDGASGLTGHNEMMGYRIFLGCIARGRTQNNDVTVDSFQVIDGLIFW